MACRLIFESIESFKCHQILKEKQLDIKEMDGKWRVVNIVTDLCWPYEYNSYELALDAVIESDKKSGEL